MFVLPVFSLFISLGQIGLPIALSRMVALDNINNHKLYFTIIPFVLIFNIILSLSIILSARFISNYLFHNSLLYLPIVAIGLVIPFTSISGICRSYFFGKERMFPHIMSNIVEDIVRLFMMLLILPKIIFLDIEYVVFFVIIFNILSEAASTLILIFFLPKNCNLFSYYCIEKNYLFDSLKIAIPNISSSLLGNIVYFFEPIILTNILLFTGYSSNYISEEYSIITGYVMPLLFLPSFFTAAISQAMLPYVSREYSSRNVNKVKNRIYFTLFFLFIFGSVCCFIFLIFGKNLLSIIYHTEFGYNYLRIIAPFCILQYLQAPMMTSLNAMGCAKKIFTLSLISSLFRICTLLIFGLFRIGIYSFILSLICNIVFNTFIAFNALKKNLSN